MPLTSSPPQSSLPRRLTFATDSAQQQYQSAMKSVQQYLRSHMPAEQLELLGVNDMRARYYYEEIQQYLAHRVSHEKQQPPQQHPQRGGMQRRDSDRLLLQNLDEFLDELDPALFELTMQDDDGSSEQLRLQGDGQLASRMKHSYSYIKKRQQEARLFRNFRHDAPQATKKQRVVGMQQ